MPSRLFSGQHWLVTGAVGFLGFHICKALLEAGARVIGLDNLDPYYDLALKQANLQGLETYDNFHFVAASIEEPEAFRLGLQPFTEALASSGGVVHLAARAGVRPSISQPGAYLKTNVEGTLNLLEWCREHGITRWVFASSSSVYGDAAHLAPFEENLPIGRPISPYAASKAMGEQLLHTYHHLYGFSVLALRFFTVYGPGQRPDLAVHKFAKLMREGKPVPIYGDGSFGRDFTYCTDTMDGVLAGCRLVRQSETPLYDIINLGNNKPHTVLELVGGLEKALGLSAKREYLPAQPGDVTLTCANINKAKQLLGYEPKVSFEEGLARFAEWFHAYYAQQPQAALSSQ